MRLRTLAAAAAATFLLAMPMTAVFAHPGGPMEGHDGMEMLHGLNLTDAQKGQVRSIVEAGRNEAKATMDKMHALHEQMLRGVLSGATMQQIAPVMREEEALRDRMDSSRLAIVLQIRGLLTSAQLATASTQHAKLAALHDQEHAVIEGR